MILLGDQIFIILRCYLRPRNAKELFNLCHAQARNVVEEIFGVVKRRFRLITAAPEYALKKQAKMVLVICVLHNFIRVHDPEDFDDNLPDEENTTTHASSDDHASFVSNEERRRANTLRDKIADNMWEQYQEYLQANE